MAVRSRFAEYLEDKTHRSTEILRKEDWLDEESGGPKLHRLVPMMGPQEEPLPDALYFILVNNYWNAAAHEALGNYPAAVGWYGLGQYLWRGERQFTADLDKDPPDIAAREAAGRNQLPAAVCASRVGDIERARQLYDWAAYNHTMTSDEVRNHTTEGELMPLWGFHSPRAYALACLGRWEEAREVDEHLHHRVSQDPEARKESYQAPLRILPVVLALARYKTEPTEGHCRRAHQMLQPQAVATRSHADPLLALFYLFNLRAGHPDLATPEGNGAFSPEGVRRAAELCQKWYAREGRSLNRTPDSLKQIGTTMEESYRRAPDDEARSGMAFLWGAYLGEVLREELAGGQWDFGGEIQAASLVWDMGVGELRVFPFRYVLHILGGKTSQSLFDLWRETERSYVEMGLAAKYAE